jgi:hypothetical protein
MATKAAATLIDKVLGREPKERRFDPARHPRAVESARARDDAGARLEAERKRLAELEGAAASARADLRAARLRHHEGAAKAADLEAARRAAEAADDAREAQRDLLEALGAKHAKLAEAHRRAVEEGERATAEAIRAAVRANVEATRALVEGERGMIALAEEREQLAREAEALSAWGSPGATRVGYLAGMGESGADILKGRGAAGLGAHAVNAVFLHDGYATGGCSWAQFIESAKRAGVIERGGRP